MAGLVLVAVAVVELGLLFEEPGAGLGLCALGYGGIILASRRAWRPEGLEWGLLGLLVLSAVQTVRWISLSNVVATGVLLLWLSGWTAYRGQGTGWSRWLDGGLTFLRPLGVALSVREQARLGEGGGEGGRLVFWLRVLLPAGVLLILFSWLLGSGNAVMGQWIRDVLETVEEWLKFIQIPEPARVLAWIFFGAIALVVISPPTMATPVLTMVSQATRACGSSVRMASSTASEIWSASLSGWPSETDSEVKML